MGQLPKQGVFDNKLKLLMRSLTTDDWNVSDAHTAPSHVDLEPTIDHPSPDLLFNRV